MSVPRIQKQRISSIVICDSVIPALLAHSILSHEEPHLAGVLIITEYPERDGGHETFFRIIEFIFKDLLHRKMVRIIRYYSNEQSLDALLGGILWLMQVAPFQYNEIKLLVSSSSKLMPTWGGLFRTTILMHSVVSVTNLSRDISKIHAWKALIKKACRRLRLHISLMRYLRGKYFWFINASAAFQLKHKARIAVPFPMQTIKYSFPVTFYPSIRNIKWADFSPEIRLLFSRFIDKDTQIITILLTGDEPFMQRRNSYNLVKYLDCYRKIFNRLQLIVDSSKRSSVIFKSHKRYSTLSVNERKIMTEVAWIIGATDCTFLEGKNAEIPVECLPVRSWDIVVSEDSFALMSMSPHAQCFYADDYFSSFRLKEEQDRTNFNKAFISRERLDVKNL